jgi:hypothetical protein
LHDCVTCRKSINLRCSLDAAACAPSNESIKQDEHLFHVASFRPTHAALSLSSACYGMSITGFEAMNKSGRWESLPITHAISQYFYDASRPYLACCDLHA